MLRSTSLTRASVVVTRLLLEDLKVKRGQDVLGMVPGDLGTRVKSQQMLHLENLGHKMGLWATVLR